MKSALRLGLRSGEKIYINGAVIRVDRKVRLELLNDATFLLEAHVMSPEEATTSLRRLYFLVQGILIDPTLEDALRSSLAASIELIVREGLSADEINVMHAVASLLDDGSYFSALKEIRLLIKGNESMPLTKCTALQRLEEIA
jgi:flagellar biosynthesis repressor protein FlbT